MKAKTKEQTSEICDHCALAAFDTKFENLNFEGKPTLIICPYYEWKIVVGSKACSNFTPKT